MADSKDEKSQTNKEESSIDLNSLSSMSLGPDWGSGRAPKSKAPRQRNESRDRPRKSSGPRRDRRKDSGRPPRREFKPAQPFSPLLAGDFYPEEEPFKALADAIKSSYRTFELFEIAQLILQKPERWVCVAKDPAQKDPETPTLFASIPDGLPFFSEAEALNHVFKNYLDQFFDMESVEAEPPSGSFAMVHRCGITGDLLAPPNYHRYQAICQQHHATKIPHVAYETFQGKLKAEKEEDVINEWLESMKTKTKYKSKTDSEKEFDTLEDARLYLTTEHKSLLVRPALSARFSGKSVSLLDPKDSIRRSIDYLHEGQVRFPLDTANHLRGRLRRMGFAVYKKGSKGVSYVCAVKRRFRKPDEVLSDNLNKLIEFLEVHPNFPAKNLPKDYLGITGPTAKSQKAEEKEVAKDAPEEEKSVVEKSDEVAPSLSEEDKKNLIELKRDLKYLVSEGYAIEYSNGNLFVPPIREEEINRLAKEKEQKSTPKPEAAKEEAPKAKELAEDAEKPAAVKSEEPTPADAPKAETAVPQPEEAEKVPVPEPKAEVPTATPAPKEEVEATTEEKPEETKPSDSDEPTKA